MALSETGEWVSDGGITASGVTVVGGVTNTGLAVFGLTEGGGSPEPPPVVGENVATVVTGSRPRSRIVVSGSRGVR